ncbi:uncharacterized protein TNCV_4620541 [Trichonephila clavipes]|nr:uncharacterized protein TNCV_4620541 [Trichonephila clavipes]
MSEGRGSASSTTALVTNSIDSLRQKTIATEINYVTVPRKLYGGTINRPKKSKSKWNIHWCAKIKDEVEKLAYQLNEEAERTERPIRRLSKVMYGSTCADMQVDVMGECLSSIKHVVGEQLSGGSVVVVHEEPHPQMTGTLSYRPEETGGRQREKSLDTRHRRLDDRYRVLPWPEDCTEVVCLHDALYGVYL